MFNSNQKAMTNFSEIYAKNYTETVNYIIYRGKMPKLHRIWHRTFLLRL